ncbi:MAG: methyltransferase domain-containing protein [Lachnospiraceae bacterium]|nr:methyltransferase domain-containing protein [Lachnospiraceae bacterium]
MISLNLFELRKSRGITQSYLAEVIGCSFQTISKWETGTAVPDVKYVIALAKFFGVTTDQILGLQPLKQDYFSRMTETDEYWEDKLHYIHSSRYELWNQDYMEFLIQKVWKIEKKVDVLDFGCGNGYLAGLTMPFLPEGSTYTGIDISEVMIQDAKYPIKFICKDAYDYQKKEKYDMVVCQAFLRELSKPKKALENMIGSLKTGGMMVCIEVNRELDHAGIYIEGLDYSSILMTEIQRKYWTTELEKSDRDYAVGIRLPFLLKDLGIKNIEVRVQDKVKFANPDNKEEYDRLQGAFVSEKGWKKDNTEGDKIAVEVLMNRGLTREEAEQLTSNWGQMKEKIMNEKKAFLKTTGFLITFGRKEQI